MNSFEMYKILELPYGASLDEIKEAYRRLVKKYHPDITKNSGTGLQLSEVTQAYKSLTAVKKKRSLVDFPVRKTKTQNKQWDKPKPAPDIYSLGNLLENGKTVGMRAFAARSLGNSGRRTAYPFLRKGLYDSSDIVVKTSVEAIGALRIFQSYGELAALFSRGTSEIREAVLDAVGKIGIDGAFKEVVEMGLTDSDPAVREAARKMSAELGKAASSG